MKRSFQLTSAALATCLSLLAVGPGLAADTTPSGAQPTPRSYVGNGQPAPPPLHPIDFRRCEVIDCDETGRNPGNRHLRYDLINTDDNGNLSTQEWDALRALSPWRW